MGKLPGVSRMVAVLCRGRPLLVAENGLKVLRGPVGLENPLALVCELRALTSCSDGSTDAKSGPSGGWMPLFMLLYIWYELLVFWEPTWANESALCDGDVR